jgi:hypothetical protein
VLLVVAAAALALAPGVVSASGRPALPPQLGRHNEIVSTGSKALAVVARRAFQISPLDNGLALDYDGRWAAFFAVRQDADGRPPRTPYTLGTLNQPPPMGCAAHERAASGCPDRRGLVLPDYLPQSVTGGGSYVGRPTQVTLHYPAGRYVLYLLTEPGHRVRVRWTVAGLSGSHRSRATMPVRAAFVARSSATSTVASWIEGSAGQRLTRYGAIVDRTWAANHPDTQYETSNHQVCVDKGEAPGGPVPRGDYCAELAPYPIPGMPSPMMAGGITYDSNTYGLSVGGLDHALVQPGSYTTSYSVHMIGRDPQTGIALLCWEYRY